MMAGDDTASESQLSGLALMKKGIDSFVVRLKPILAI